jgi:hypothetical protein
MMRWLTICVAVIVDEPYTKLWMFGDESHKIHIFILFYLFMYFFLKNIIAILDVDTPQPALAIL